jgi:hypothetical protein
MSRSREISVLAAGVMLVVFQAVFAQQPSSVDHAHHMQHDAGEHSTSQSPSVPTLPGQDAFGAIQEIVHILEADPTTDWSMVDLEALRQHLIDMNEVTLRARVTTKRIDGGLEISVKGTGRALSAIRRMVPAHAQELNAMNGWSAGTQNLSDGVLLRVTSRDPKEAAHIWGLGFIGLLVSGSHHQRHHLALAKGEMVHRH